MEELLLSGIERTCS